MKVTALSIGNFLAIEEATVTLDDKGLLLLQGSNEDDPSTSSNGAGKSSLMEALPWVLWGKTARGITGDDVIRTGSKRAEVAVQLLDEQTGDLWQVLRTRQKGKGTLTLEHTPPGAGKVMEVTLGTEKLTQAKIAAILGCSEEVFNAAVYIGQERLVDLPAMTDKQLKELVEEAAGVKILEAAYSRAKERVANVTKEVDALTARRTGCAGSHDNLNEQHRLETENAKRWDDDRGKRRAEIGNKGMEVKGEIVALDEALDDPAWVAQVQEEIDEIDRRLKLLGRERTEERRLADLVTKAQSARAVAMATAKRLAEQVKRLKEELGEVEHKIGEPCSECGTALTATHLCATKDAAMKRLADAGATLRTEHGKFTAASATLAEAEGALETHRKVMHDPSALTAERAKLAEIVTKNAAVKKEIVGKRAQLHGLIEDLRALDAAENPHHENIKKIQERIGAVLNELEEVADQLDAKQLIYQNENLAMQVFSPAGVRAHILDEVTPYLNERTSAYLGTLSDGQITAVWTTLVKNAKGELREKFSIDVTHAMGGGSFHALSGGEKRKVRIACALALQDLVASRATKPFALWIGDELDGALDPHGLERLMAVLQEKAKERGTVVVISHSNLTDWISTVWTVTKKAGAATVSV